MNYDLPKPESRSKVREAAVAYIADRRNEAAMTTISSKNQITLPISLLRELGLAAGDRLAITREGERLVLRARPRDWVSYHAGSLAGLYGDSREEIDAYVREERQSLERADETEGAWAGTDAPPR